MQFKNLALFFLSAASIAFAAPEQEKRQNINNIPTSIEAVLLTAVPASVIAGLATPSVSAALISAFAAGSYPPWFLSLPADVKTYFATAYGSLVATASGNSAITPATTPSGPSDTSGSSPVSPGGSSTTSGSSGSTSGASAAGSSSSKAAAPAATAGIALGVAGAAGVLGMALIL